MVEEMGEDGGRSCKPWKMNESLPRSLFTFHVRRAAKATTIPVRLDAAEKPAGTGRAVFLGERERGALRRRRARARQDFKTVNHRPYTPCG